MQIKNGSGYNLTSITMCVHNSTHVDAPFHYIDDATTVDNIPLDKCVGLCTVFKYDGILEKKAAQNMLRKSYKKILIKGNAELTQDAAEYISENIELIGVEKITVGSDDVHRVLLSKGVAIVESLDLSCLSEGEYWLSAAPLKLGGCDGAPCRAYVIMK